MYAVISTGGKQYRLEQGDRIEVESLRGEVGDKVVFDQVLALGDEKTADFGSPTVDGAQVIGKIVEHGKGSKVTILKFKRRKMYRKRTGHRQLFTAVEIESIQSGRETKASSEKKTKKAAAKDKAKAAAKKASKTVKKETAESKKTEPVKKPAVKKAASSSSAPAKKAAGKSAAKAENGTEETQE